MVKKTITYKNYNGIEVTEDFYFNLTEAEVMEMEMSTKGGLAEQLERIIAANDAPSIIKEFKDLVLKAYGEKSADGKHFRKNDQIREDFAATEAYSIMFMEIATNTDAATSFVNGIIPPKKTDPKAVMPAQ